MAWWGWVGSTVCAVTIDQASFEPVYRQLPADRTIVEFGND